MKLTVDTHTHTIASGHAYSTVQEIAREAANNGIGMFAVTDHGPSLPDAPHLWHIGNLKELPPEIYGVRVLKGAEANIIDYSGGIDIPVEYLKRLDFVIASYHDVCIKPSTVEDHTNAMVNVLKNPYVDAVAHPGNPQFQVDIVEVVAAAREYNKMIEINNHSFEVRAGSERNCKEFALKCKQYGVRIVCGSDAHISFNVGKFDKVASLLDEVGMPEELVLNTSVEKLENYLKERKRRISELSVEC